MHHVCSKMIVILYVFWEILFMSESYLQATQSLRTFPTEKHCIWAISYHLKGNSCLLFYFFMSKNAMGFLTKGYRCR